MLSDKLAKLLGKNEAVFKEISSNLEELENRLFDLNEDIRKSVIELNKQSDNINRLETGIEHLVLNLKDDSGKRLLYSNERSRTVAIKQRQFENSLYQKATKSRAKWKDDLNKLKNEREHVERQIKNYHKILDVFISLRKNES